MSGNPAQRSGVPSAASTSLARHASNASLQSSKSQSGHSGSAATRGPPLAISGAPVSSSPQASPRLSSNNALPVSGNGRSLAVGGRSNGGGKGKASVSTPTALMGNAAIGEESVWKSSAAKRAEKAWAVQSEKTLQSDSKFKKYASSVEKALASFESVAEWADFIAFLARLLKTLQAFPQFAAIPRKLIVAKRLSQCLNPALPSGVHARALEVYAHIFETIGSEGIRRDLAVWSPGLLPFFQSASTSIKPTVLGLFERFYLPLEEDLRPVTRALLLALLPGLEEDTGEFFDRVLRLLDRLQLLVKQPFFLQNVWLILVSSPSIRLAALNYLSRRLPPLNGPFTQKDVVGRIVKSSGDLAQVGHAHASDVVGRDIGLLARAFAAALEDPVLLVRRAALDLLVTHLRLDSHTFKKLIPSEEQVGIVRAGMTVVLRRDLSLNRRLYAWLLGPSEDTQAQRAYFKEHALALVRQALIEDVYAEPLVESVVKETALTQEDVDADVEARQRPLRIFVSLLDKWEIGQALTNDLVIDLLRALQSQLAEDVNPRPVGVGEILTTAKMLFEAIDPFATYRQFFSALHAEMSFRDESSQGSSSSTSAIVLLQFVLQTFRVHDEETRQIHIPMLVSALAELVDEAAQPDTELSEGQQRLLDQALDLTSELLSLIPARVFVCEAVQSVETTESQRAFSKQPRRFVDQAKNFYGERGADVSADEAAAKYIGFHHPEVLKDLLDTCAGIPMRLPRYPKLFINGLRLTTELLAVYDAAEEPSVRALATSARSESNAGIKVGTHTAEAGVAWNAAGWGRALMLRLEDAQAFEEVDHIIDGLIAAATCRPLVTRLSIGDRSQVVLILNKLQFFLQPDFAPYHVRAIELLWTVQQLARGHHVEAIFSENICSRKASIRQRWLNAFGVLWAMTDERDASLTALRIPLLRVAEGLHSDCASTRHSSEAWLRTYMKSYLPLLEPLVAVMHHPSSRAADQQRVVSSEDDDTAGLLAYPQPFDYDDHGRALQLLLCLLQFGGSVFLAFARGARLEVGHLRSAAMDYDLLANHEGEDTYLDAIIEGALLDVRSRPASDVEAAYAFRHLQSVLLSLDILQIIAGEAHLSVTALEAAERRILQRLISSSTIEQTQLQAKLLRVLHTVSKARGNLSSKTPRGGPGSIINSRQSARIDSAVVAKGTHPHPLLLRALREGLSIGANADALSVWAEFACNITQLYPSAEQKLLLPLADHICALLRSAIDKIDLAFGLADALPPPNANCGVTDSAIALLLNVAERALASSLAKDRGTFAGEAPGTVGDGDANSTPAPSVNEKSDAAPSTGLFGYVSNVFSSESSAATNSASPAVAANALSRTLHHVVRTLHKLYSTVRADRKLPLDSRGLAFEAMAPKVRARCRRTLERLYRTHSGEVVESLIDCWDSDARQEGAEASADAQCTFAILSFLAPSAQMVVTFLCDVLNTRTSTSISLSEKRARGGTEFIVSETTLFCFLEVYLGRLDQTSATQVWPVVTILVKEIIKNSASHKARIFPTLRVLTTIGEKLSQTSPPEDKQVRRELADHVVALTDLAITISGRSFGAKTWMRRSGKDADVLSVNGDGKATPDDRMAQSLTEPTQASGLLPQLINEYLATRILPALRKFGVHQDKMLAICTNAIYYIVAPSLKSRDEALDIDVHALKVLRELTRQSGALKTWRGLVADTFGDPRFFSMAPKASIGWQPIVFALHNSDRERFNELLNKAVAPPSANIFANRETETLTRCLNMRRASFVIFSGPKDHFIPLLPSIQEKVVDILRTSNADRSAAEVYLCMRVLLRSFSTQHLAGFWPVIITEMMRLFESLSDELPADGSDALHSVLSACKFLDLLLTLQTDDFQIHQWMFITDTSDVVYPSDDWAPESVMERVASVIEERRPAPLQRGSQTTSSVLKTSATDLAGAVRRLQKQNSRAGPLRRPLLCSTRSVQSIEALQHFFAHVSLASYESTRACTSVDFEAIDDALRSEFFDLHVA
ncbi:hypothetical protein IE81DRAFT_309697 [Ceraceosorus guamensis]|uniref:Uncharacterized protein n=1 Tax=Ceraceosorus guamensis TaxID=1522189 RepID=A0A316W523_9BASI|nr:hypothetical protein IE81DRAFT_309697 [Ceraceosorus guamensis]PWN45010.1 hypothetical protein IE81DRAFT_309697 [Ceraceosorus guamensis]